MPKPKLVKYAGEILQLIKQKKLTWKSIMIHFGLFFFNFGFIILLAQIFGLKEVLFKISLLDYETLDVEWGIAFLFFIFGYPFFFAGILFSWHRTSKIVSRFWPLAILLVLGSTYPLVIASDNLEGCLMHDQLIEYDAAQGNLEEVKAYLEKHPDDSSANRLLANAVELGQVEVMKYLLDRGAEPNMEALEFGKRVRLLNLGMKIGNPEVVSMLVDHGADMNSMFYETKESGLYLSTWTFLRDGSRRLQLIDTLISKGISLEAVNTRGDTLC